jgi:hypothetical protein
LFFRDSVDRRVAVVQALEMVADGHRNMPASDSARDLKNMCPAIAR